MIRYFQLTPDILLEYIYENDPKLNEDGTKGNEKDIYDDAKTILLNSEAFSSKYLFFKDKSESDMSERLVSLSNLVLPLNNTETQFVLAKSKYQNFYSTGNTSNRYLTQNGSGYIYENTNYDNNIKESCDVKYDKCIVHFTSRKYFGNYDSLIFQAYVYMSNKTKLYFASFLLKRTSNINITQEQFLYNEKLYTTQIEFDIPNVTSIFANENYLFVEALKSQNVELLENTPIGINIYGVTGSITGTDNYERYKTLKISSISIPYTYNKFDEISVEIYEASDGDYYYIEPKISSDYPSIVDYVSRMGNDIRIYIIMHELYLRESWIEDNVSKSEITHKEIHIIDINENDDGDDISKKFNDRIKYRPICVKSGSGYTATIIDTIKIINSIDSSSYEVTGSVEINPHKYGKKIKGLDIKNFSIVNVYNKNIVSGGDNYRTVSVDNSGNLSNSISNSISKDLVVNKGNVNSGSFVVENITQNITSFIECTNIGVNIVELTPDDIK